MFESGASHPDMYNPASIAIQSLANTQEQSPIKRQVMYLYSCHHESLSLTLSSRSGQRIRSQSDVLRQIKHCSTPLSHTHTHRQTDRQTRPARLTASATPSPLLPRAARRPPRARAHGATGNPAHRSHHHTHLWNVKTSSKSSRWPATPARARALSAAEHKSR